MGFKKPINVDDVILQLSRAHNHIGSPYSDGFSAFYIKQDLYRIKFILDEMLKDLPEFVGESEWLEEQEKKKIWRELKK